MQKISGHCGRLKTIPGSGGLDSVYVEGVMDEVDSAEEIGELIDSHYM